MTTTTDERALLRAVLAEPYEDTVRLVYADWCEENGDGFQRQHAEFIRRAVAVAADEGRREPCLKDSYTVTEDGWWFQMIARWPRPLPVEWHWVRGFCMSIHIEAAAFMGHAESIFRAHPVVKVVLTDKRPWVGRYSATDSAPNLWGWWRLPERGEAPDILPRALMERLIADPRRDGPNPNAYRPDIDTGSVVFFHEQSALDALSGACVAYGRSLAQLPPLEVRA